MNDPIGFQNVVIIDGTLSRLTDGFETNCGLIYKALQSDEKTKLVYHPGIQGKGLTKWWSVITGHGINDSIIDSYIELSKNYVPGEPIFLFGYSRGAYAIRSLAGMMFRLGLLRPHFANRRHADVAFRLYASPRFRSSGRRFRRGFCRETIPKIKFLGCFDTVKALGIPLPGLSRFAPFAAEFHSENITPNIENAYQALALDEVRRPYEPILWKHNPAHSGIVKQVWFKGSHADIGGHYNDPTHRAFSTESLNWMLKKAQHHGLRISSQVDDLEITENAKPERLEWYWWLIASHEPRQAGLYANEKIHSSVVSQIEHGYEPKAHIHHQAFDI